jgi:hypothetical protein
MTRDGGDKAPRDALMHWQYMNIQHCALVTCRADHQNVLHGSTSSTHCHARFEREFQKMKFSANSRSYQSAASNKCTQVGSNVKSSEEHLRHNFFLQCNHNTPPQTMPRMAEQLKRDIHECKTQS